MLKLALVTILSAYASAAVPVGAPDPSHPETALDFFLGRWRTVGGVPKPDGGYTQTVGVLIGERVFERGSTPNVLVRTIQERSRASGDNPFELDYFESVDAYVYHADSRTWRGISHNTLANRKWRDVTIGDGTMSFVQTGELFRAAEDEGALSLLRHHPRSLRDALRPPAEPRRRVDAGHLPG